MSSASNTFIRVEGSDTMRIVCGCESGGVCGGICSLEEGFSIGSLDQFGIIVNHPITYKCQYCKCKGAVGKQEHPHVVVDRKDVPVSMIFRMGGDIGKPSDVEHEKKDLAIVRLAFCSFPCMQMCIELILTQEDDVHSFGCFYCGEKLKYGELAYRRSQMYGIEGVIAVFVCGTSSDESFSKLDICSEGTKAIIRKFTKTEAIRKSTHCANCKKLNARKKCSRCLSAYYCAKECQKKHWRIHKKDCCEVSDECRN